MSTFFRCDTSTKMLPLQKATIVNVLHRNGLNYTISESILSFLLVK